MTRDVRLYVVGSLVGLSLAGCAHNFFAQRETWRREAELQCLKSGAVKQGPSVALVSPIDGPGVCGADFPIKVAALGEPSAALGYSDETLRPPGNVARPTNDLPSAPNGRALGAPAGYLRVPERPIRYAPPDTVESAPIAPMSRAAPPYQPPFGERVPLAPSRVPPALTVAAASVTPPATLACPMVSALDRWVSEQVQPAAQRWFGRPVVEIKQISAYSCRGMNGNSHSRISEHAFGNALDISAFVLADGHAVTIKGGWRGSPEEQGFLRDVQGSACEAFSTVLAPGSNIYHYDHIHVDLMRRTSGRSICQPAAVPGDVAAARARTGRYAAAPGERSITGSIAERRRAAVRLPDARFEDDRDLPSAMPGND